MSVLGFDTAYQIIVTIISEEFVSSSICYSAQKQNVSTWF